MFVCDDINSCSLLERIVVGDPFLLMFYRSHSDKKTSLFDKQKSSIGYIIPKLQLLSFLFMCTCYGMCCCCGIVTRKFRCSTILQNYY